MFKKRNVLILFGWLACFSFGVFLFRIYSSTDFTGSVESDYLADNDVNFTVRVGDYLITRSDIEWEYLLYTSGVDLSETKSAATFSDLSSFNLQNDPEGKKPIAELYNKIMGDLIERKLLFQFIKKDSAFNIDDPARYVDCLDEWQKSTMRHPQIYSSIKSSERLKALLCEKSVLDQYLKERIEANIRISDLEMQNYFKQHEASFTNPSRVTIRQILLASESDAKKVRAMLNVGNFEVMVKQHSIAPEAEIGGVIGPFSKGEMPSIFDIAFEMKLGEIQGIIKSPYGFHIVMLEKKYPKSVATFEHAKGKVRDILFNKKREEEYTKWVESALNSIPIRSSKRQ